MKSIKSLILAVLFILNFGLGQDNLKINFLPSSKYKLNKKDLNILKDDLERQISQRVFELQAGWDEREKLRRNTISRPPVIPPYPIPSPPVNIPLNGNAFAANLNFDNPSYNPNLGSDDNTSNPNHLENRITDFIDQKVQKDLTTQIALTKQAISKLNREIENNALQKVNSVQVDLGTANLGVTNPQPKVLTNQEIKGLSFVEKGSKMQSKNEKEIEQKKDEEIKLKKADLSEADSILNKLQSPVNEKKERPKLSETASQLRFEQLSNTSQSSEVNIDSLNISKDSLKYKVLQNFYEKHNKDSVPSVIPYKSQLSETNFKQLSNNPNIMKSYLPSPYVSAKSINLTQPARSQGNDDGPLDVNFLA